MVQKYHNPDPLLRLIGLANETTVIVEGQKFLALIDTRAQLSTMSRSLVQALKLPTHRLNTWIEAEASGGGIIPYEGYVEARLAILGIAKMDQDLLFMVSNNSPYTKRLPLQIGTIHIWEALQATIKEELQVLPQAWETAGFPLPTVSKSGILRESEFNLDNVRGYVKLTKSITIGPFQTMHTSGLTECSQHFKRVNVVVESDPHREYDAVIPIHGYTVLKPGSSRVSIGIHNISCRQVTIPAKTNFAKIAAANVVPHSYAPTVESDEQAYQGCNNNPLNNIKEEFSGSQNTKVEKVLEPPVLTPERESLLFSKINLEGTEDWSEEFKLKTKDLFREYAHIFALESLEMGHTSLVKHKIKLDNYTPFKERYQRIPPTLFDEVKKHLKEMFQVGAIRCSNSPWASAVVLVRKKDGSLCFCIDL